VSTPQQAIVFFVSFSTPICSLYHYRLQINMGLKKLYVVSQKNDIADWEHCRRFQERLFSRRALERAVFGVWKVQPKHNRPGSWSQYYLLWGRVGLEWVMSQSPFFITQSPWLQWQRRSDAPYSGKSKTTRRHKSDMWLAVWDWSCIDFYFWCWKKFPVSNKVLFCMS
jgi:hypothetical protein